MQKPHVEQPGVAELLQRTLDTPFGFGYAEGELRAVLQALDLTDHQYLKLAGITSWAAGGAVPAVAGATSIATLQNPPGKKIARVRRIILATSAANQSVFWGCLSGLIAPAVLNQVAVASAVRDTRMSNIGGAANTSQAKAIYGTTLGTPTVGELAQMLAASPPQVIPVDFTIAPGGWFYVAGQGVNTAFNCTIVWDERQAVSSELNIPG